MTDSTIPQDVEGVTEDTAFESTDDAANAFMDAWKDEETPSDEAREEGDTDDDAEPENSDDEDGEYEEEDSDEETDEDEEDHEDSENDQDNDDESDDSQAKAPVADDAEVEVKIGDEVKRVSVRDLKRLYGQEASLTNKSQELATKRRQLDEQGQATAAILKRQYDKALERFKPYKDIDFFVASREMDADEFTALRKEAQQAQEEIRFFESEIEGFMTDIQSRQQEALRQQAQEALPKLKERIPEWSNELYDDIRTYAIGEGMDSTTVNRIVDPAAITMMHKARLYDQMKAKATEKKAKTPAKKRKVAKPGSANNKLKTKPSNKAMDRFKQSGSVEDAEAAFLARWSDN